MYRWAWRFYLLLAVAGLFWIGVREGRIRADLFFAPTRLVLDIGVGIGVGAALLGLWEIARRTLPSARVLEEKLLEALGEFSLADARAVAFLSAVGEEVFFRGAVQGSWGPVPAAVLFTLLHVGPGREYRIWTGYTAVAGIALGALVAWSGNLTAAILAHFVVNLVGLDRLARQGRLLDSRARENDDTEETDGGNGSRFE